MMMMIPRRRLAWRGNISTSSSSKPMVVVVVVVVRRLVRRPCLLLLLVVLLLDSPLLQLVTASHYYNNGSSRRRRLPASSSAAATITGGGVTTTTAAAAFQQQQYYHPTTRSPTRAPRFSSSASWRRYYHRRSHHCSTTSTNARRAGDEEEESQYRESLVKGMALAAGVEGPGLNNGRQQRSTDWVVREEGHDGSSSRRIRCTGRNTTTRRAVVMALLVTGTTTGSSLLCPWKPAAAAAAQAMEEKKPYAPSIENLLPATRVRLWINRAFDLTTEIIDSPSRGISSRADDEKNKLIAELQDLLLTPKEFTTSNAEMKASKMYLKTNTYDNLARVQREKMAASNRMMTMDNNNNNNNPLIGISEGLERFGERNQFSTLRQRQRSLEKSNPIRAAFNAYTNNLVFTGTDYQLNANKEEKSKLIRKYGQLPDVASVVKSDLDLRDLYRNQILTSIDDAKAELQYQLSLLQQQPKQAEFDATDVLVFLKEAQSNCNSWFEFVPEQDMKDAMEAVVRY